MKNWIKITFIYAFASFLALATSIFVIPELIPDSAISIYLDSKNLTEGEVFSLKYHIINNRNIPMTDVVLINSFSLGNIPFDPQYLGNVSGKREIRGTYYINSSDIANLTFLPESNIKNLMKLDVKDKKHDWLVIISYNYEGEQTKVTLTTDYQIN